MEVINHLCHKLYWIYPTRILHATCFQIILHYDNEMIWYAYNKHKHTSLIDIAIGFTLSLGTNPDLLEFIYRELRTKFHC